MFPIEHALQELQKCTGPDRELDALIEHALGMSHSFMYGRHEVRTTIGKRTTISKEPYAYPTVKHYTGKIDDAVRLVPSGYDWVLYSDASGEIGPEPECGCIMSGKTFEGATPAIGLTIGALRAHVEQDRQDR